VTEHVWAKPGPPGRHEPSSEKVPLAALVNATVPLGVRPEPKLASATDAVHVTGLATVTAAGVQLTSVLVPNERTADVALPKLGR
jgi:hypothetical protein